MNQNPSHTHTNLVDRWPTTHAKPKPRPQTTAKKKKNLHQSTTYNPKSKSVIEPTIHGHNHQTMAISSPQSSDHNHRWTIIIDEPQSANHKEWREKKEVREKRERQKRERAMRWIKKIFFIFLFLQSSYSMVSKMRLYYSWMLKILRISIFNVKVFLSFEVLKMLKK